MSFKARNRIIFAKIESTYGTDPTPVEGTDCILTKGVSRNPYEGSRVGRDLDKPYLGSDKQINVGPNVTISFDVELAGSGTAGTAPQLDCLLRACGMSVTNVASTSDTYAPVSDSFESVTLYYFMDGERQVITGARGNVSISMSRGGLPMLSFTFTGLYAKPTAVALPDPTYNAIAPVPFNKVNTTTFSVHSQAVYGESFTLNLSNELAYRNLAGYEGVELADRAPGGSVNFEQVLISDKDFWTAAESHGATIATGAISIVHGTAAGNIVTITCGQVQLTSITEVESDKIMHHQCDFVAVPTDSGNDEFSIAFT